MRDAAYGYRPQPDDAEDGGGEDESEVEGGRATRDAVPRSRARRGARHSADEQALLVDLDPGARRSVEDDVVAGLDGHPDADVLPPVEPRPDREDDPLLRRRVVAARRDDEAGAPHAVGVELLYHDAVEQRPQLVAGGLDEVDCSRCSRPRGYRSRAQAATAALPRMPASAGVNSIASSSAP